MRRGDVFWATLEPRSGSEQRGTRPVVILSTDALNEIPTWSSVVVVPISTSPSQMKRSHISVPLPQGAGGLPAACVVLCHQVTTLDRSKLGKRLGALSPEQLAAISEGLRLSLGMP